MFNRHILEKSFATDRQSWMQGKNNTAKNVYLTACSMQFNFPIKAGNCAKRRFLFYYQFYFALFRSFLSPLIVIISDRLFYLCYFVRFSYVDPSSLSICLPTSSSDASKVKRFGNIGNMSKLF